MVLRTLTDHNEIIKERYREAAKKPQPAGVACNLCKLEMVMLPGTTRRRTSGYPWEVYVECTHCLVGGLKLE